MMNIKKTAAGLFAGEKIKIGAFVCEVVANKNGVTHQGAKITHRDDSNCDVIIVGSSRYLMAVKKIQTGEELTADYNKLANGIYTEMK